MSRKGRKTSPKNADFEQKYSHSHFVSVHKLVVTLLTSGITDNYDTTDSMTVTL